VTAIDRFAETCSERDLQPGETFVVDRGKWLLFRCPRTGRECQIALSPQRNANGASWRWDGSADAPTVEPSVNCGGCGWHGWIRSGEFVGA
jgi:hypothetical protein